MTRIMIAVFTLALALGCAPAPVEVELAFPSLETFLFSDFGRLAVYDLEDDELGRCPAILDRIATGQFDEPELDTSWIPICAFRNGATRFPHVAPGPHAYVAVARDDANTILLSGCRVAEVYEGAPVVEVDLFPSAAYAGAVERRTVPWSSEEGKCAGR